MTHAPFGFYQSNTFASGSSFNVKRKLDSDGAEDEQYHQPIRVKSPPLKRRATFPAPPHRMPELVNDYSTSAATSDDDVAMDQDDAPSGFEVQEDRGFEPHYDYEYGMSGSGGIGFGPGAEEDMLDSDEYDEPNNKTTYAPFPSYTPHTNPHHFSNIPPYTAPLPTLPGGQANPFARATSPLNAQPFSTTLPAPSRANGVFQPMQAGPVSATASEVEKARSVHGPNCKSIPKLVISPHANPTTGKQSMYAMCPDCGAIDQTPA